MENKRLLAPFKDIKCPANPGYGHPDYVGYETGLWGYPRMSYKNTCDPDTCIIQDSWTNEIILQGTIGNVDYWIYNKINPDCLAT